MREIEVMRPSGRQRSHRGRKKLRFGYRCLRGLSPGSVIVSVLLAVGTSTPKAVCAEVDRTLARRAET